jgi:hypothetical protein
MKKIESTKLYKYDAYGLCKYNKIKIWTLLQDWNMWTKLLYSRLTHYWSKSNEANLSKEHKDPKKLYIRNHKRNRKHLRLGIIKESSCPWCSRVVPVRKKDGSFGLCIDL